MFLKTIGWILLIGHMMTNNSYGKPPPKWVGQIPKVATNQKDWLELHEELKSKKKHYGRLALSQRLLIFFKDLETKEFAYRQIVELIDLAYPFSVRKLFVPGDIEPQEEDSFRESYNLYKAMANVEKKTTKWADYFFNQLDKEKSLKYLFYQAMELVKENKTADAIAKIQSILQLVPPDQTEFAKKVARTLARIYYETGEYEKSLDVYLSFLLRTNPVTPSDYLETAWSLFRLKRYDEALGALYNMESKSAHHLILLEKYVVRALIYRDYCDTDSTEELLKSFEHEFGSTIHSIKTGEALKTLPLLTRIEHPETLEYRQAIKTIEELEYEKLNLEELSAKTRELATYLYDTELKAWYRQRSILEDQALETLANYIVILGESLRFLQFDVIREKFSPDRVFQVTPQSKILVEDVDDQNFRLHWTQMGDFWRDERTIYRGLIKNKCDLVEDASLKKEEESELLDLSD